MACIFITFCAGIFRQRVVKRKVKQSRWFMSGSRGGGVQVSLTKKGSDVCFFCIFLSPQLILQKSNGQFQSNISFFKVSEGV